MAVAVVFATGLACSQYAIAGPSDDCDNLPPGKSCNTLINETCCTVFQNGQPVDEIIGRLQ